MNEADNVADDQDFLLLFFTFRVQDQPYWVQGVEIPFTISAAYISDYIQRPTLLVDDSIVLTVVEPQLSLRAEVGDCLLITARYFQGLSHHSEWWHSNLKAVYGLLIWASVAYKLLTKDGVKICRGCSRDALKIFWLKS